MISLLFSYRKILPVVNFGIGVLARPDSLVGAMPKSTTGSIGYAIL